MVEDNLEFQFRPKGELLVKDVKSRLMDVTELTESLSSRFRDGILGVGPHTKFVGATIKKNNFMYQLRKNEIID